jgi:hypothetical protein
MCRVRAALVRERRLALQHQRPRGAEGIRMATRRFALIMGIIFLLVGVMGFIPQLLVSPADHPHGQHGVTVNQFEGYLLGLFHVNILHSLVHVLFGIMGIAMARRWDSARSYARIVAISYGLLTIMGLIPGLNTVFGLIPIHGHDVWLHAVIALAAAYFGFAVHSTADDRHVATATTTGDAGPRTY